MDIRALQGGFSTLNDDINGYFSLPPYVRGSSLLVSNGSLVGSPHFDILRQSWMCSVGRHGEQEFLFPVDLPHCFIFTRFLPLVCSQIVGLIRAAFFAPSPILSICQSIELLDSQAPLLLLYLCCRHRTSAPTTHLDTLLSLVDVKLLQPPPTSI